MAGYIHLLSWIAKSYPTLLPMPVSLSRYHVTLSLLKHSAQRKEYKKQLVTSESSSFFFWTIFMSPTQRRSHTGLLYRSQSTTPNQPNIEYLILLLPSMTISHLNCILLPTLISSPCIYTCTFPIEVTCLPSRNAHIFQFSCGLFNPGGAVAVNLTQEPCGTSGTSNASSNHGKDVIGKGVSFPSR